MEKGTAMDIMDGYNDAQRGYFTEFGIGIPDCKLPISAQVANTATKCEQPMYGAYSVMYTLQAKISIYFIWDKLVIQTGFLQVEENEI